MEPEVRKAIESLRADLDGDRGPQEQTTVYKDELGTLLRWAEEEAAERDRKAEEVIAGMVGDLKAGDTVETLIKLGVVGEGVQGIIADADADEKFPFVVRFKSGRQYMYQRHELRKV